MKIFKFIISITILCFVVQSCGSTKEVPTTLLTAKWELKSINNQKADEAFTDKIPHLELNFGSNQISGYSGCNSFSGQFSYSKGKLRISNIVSTEISCPSGDNEAIFLGLLGNDSELSIINNELTLSQNKNVVLVFQRSKSVSTKELGGIWKLESIDMKEAEVYFKEKMPTLQFDFADSKLIGNAGCNDYTSSFTLSDNTLNIGPFLTTRRDCEELKSETEFINLLPGTINFRIEDNKLIFSKEGKQLMIFER